MPIIDPERLESIITSALEDFYKRRLDSIDKLKLNDVLKRKNPYLYRAIGYTKANDIVEELLSAYIISSDEGMFGGAFFEKVALESCEGHESGNDSIDIEIHSESTVKAIAVKSGPSVFNSQSKKRQDQAFQKFFKILSKVQKQFDPIVGYCYGNKKSSKTKYIFKELAGQVFWEELTGDSEFYLKLINLMGDKPQEHYPVFREAYGATVNLFLGEFIKEFCFDDGRIDWEKLVKFNSGRKIEKSTKKKKSAAKKKTTREKTKKK